jgi:hypothetical protein
MPPVPEWDVLLRGGVLRGHGQRGCRSRWTVSNFRGRAWLRIKVRAGGGHRKQLLLPYPWEKDQLEAIRDGVDRGGICEADHHTPVTTTTGRRSEGVMQPAHSNRPPQMDLLLKRCQLCLS